MTQHILTQAQLKEVLHYCPDTGVFTWIKNTGSRKMIGKEAGCLSYYGYIVIRINRRMYPAHRLAWLYITGGFPVDQIDHINRKRTDNRINNLRPVNGYENHSNKKNNASFIGVTWHAKSKAWVARKPCKNGRSVQIGQYKTHYAACYARHYWNISNKWHLFQEAT